MIAPLARAITGATRTAAFALIELFAGGAAGAVVEQLAEVNDKLDPHLLYLVGLLETAEPDMIAVRYAPAASTPKTILERSQS